MFTELVYNDLQFLLINVHLKGGLYTHMKDRGSQMKSCLKEFKKSPTCIIY